MTNDRYRASADRRESIASGDDEDVELSVVVITKNEADRIGECIESIFAASRRAVDSFEVILVDSDSTDRTRDIAIEYPISVHRIPEEHVVGGGAGRFVGENFAQGDMLLHVDGDMILTPTWLEQAVSYLGEHGDVAAVEGCLNEANQSGVVEVETIGGVMLFDTAILQSIGGFNPFLLGYEDIDLGYRIIEQGHTMVRLPEVSADHPSEGAIEMPLRRWRAGYYVGPGQAIRKSISSPRRVLKLVALQEYKLLLLAWIVMGVYSLTAIAFLFSWIALSVVGFVIVAKRRGLFGTVEFFLTKSLALLGLIRGLRKPTPPRDTYPLEAVEVLKVGPVHYTDGSTTDERERPVERQS